MVSLGVLETAVNSKKRRISRVSGCWGQSEGQLLGPHTSGRRNDATCSQGVVVVGCHLGKDVVIAFPAIMGRRS